MKKSAIPAFIALILVASNSALAQPYGPGSRGHGPQHAPDVRGHQHDSRPQLRGHRPGPPAHAARPTRFHKGDRVPANFRSRHYVVNDWRGHRLRQPPRGHQWVQVGAEYALMAIATGIVIDIVVNR